MSIYKLGALLLALLLATGSVHAASGASDSEPKVEAEWSKGGWRVRRFAGDELKVTLKLKFDQKVRSVPGDKQGEYWVFWVASEKPQSEESIELEFVLENKATDADQQKLTQFAEQVTDAVFATYTEQFKDESDLSKEARLEAVDQLAGKKIDELLKNDPLSGLTIDAIPASEQVLLKMGFRKGDQGQWEVTGPALDTLRGILPSRQSFWLVQKFDEQRPALPCLEAQDVESQLNGCAKELRPLLEKLPTPRSQDVQSFLDDADIQAERTGTVVLDDKAAANDVPGLATKYGYLTTLPNGLTGPAQQLAAALIWSVQRPYYDREAKALKDAWAKALVDEAKLASVKVDKRTKDSATITILPGNPRFFFSTGLTFTFLDDRVKMGLPLMASICASTRGCGSDGLPGWSSHGLGQLVSLDIGVNVTTFGKTEPRLSQPMFFVGGGLNLLYATHVSVGAALFENPQTDRTNSAVYLSLTLDLVDGKDILGGLGISKPEVQVYKP